MAIKNDSKFEKESTCQFKIDVSISTNFNPSTRKSKKYALYELLLTTVYNVWVKQSTEKLCLMAVKTDAKFEGKLTCAF